MKLKFIIPGVIIILLILNVLTPRTLTDAQSIPASTSPSNSWTPVGNGLSGWVYSLAMSGRDLIVGGDFTIAGEPAMTNLARWDGSTWHALGSGVASGRVNVITVEGRYVYIGGAFTSAGGILNTAYLARWDSVSETWNALGTGVDGLITSIAVEGTDIFVGGNFENAGGVYSPFIARWDGTSWHTFSSEVFNGTVHAIVVAGTDIFIGGGFEGLAGTMDRLTRWDGSSFNDVGTPENIVRAIQVVGTNVYVAGDFTNVEGVPGTSHIACLDRQTSTWHALGSGLPGIVVTLAVAGSSIYAGGDLNDPSGYLDGIARWDGKVWRPLGVGLNDNVLSIAVDGPHLYAGGEFTEAGGMTGANYLAMWDASGSDPQWNAVGGGLNGNVWDIVPVGGDIYMAGFFNNAGGSGANFITRWDGSSWHQLGTNKNNVMRAAAVEGSNLYVGGNFTDPTGNQDYIARWDMLSASWNAVGSGLPGEVYDLAATGGSVYAGGVFTDAEAGSLDYIAHFDGSTWQPLDEGLNGNVYTLASSGPDVYVGGAFTDAGGSGANYIARWDTRTSTWNPVGNGLNNAVYSILVSGPILCVGGSFTSAGGSGLIRFLTCLEDGVWVNMDSLDFGRVNTIVLSGGRLYVGCNGPNYIKSVGRLRLDRTGRRPEQQCILIRCFRSGLVRGWVLLSKQLHPALGNGLAGTLPSFNSQALKDDQTLGHFSSPRV